jgi:uncharacterized membrane protein
MQARPRLEWLDLFRGTAVLVMIETHVVNTFLGAGHKEQPWFPWLNYANGMVAPAFLFIAGYVLGLQTPRRSSARAFPWRKLRRLGVVLAIGYALHFPWEKLRGGLDSGALIGACMVDVLQCLAVSLGLLVIASHYMGRWVDWLVRLALVAVVFAAPFASSWRTGIVPLDAYVNESGGSLFPLFPWAGFVFAGFVLTRWELHRIAWVGLAAVLGGVVWIVPAREFSAAQPEFFAARMAWLALLMPAFALLRNSTLPRWWLLAGNESLVMYVAHLVILHAPLFSFGSLASGLGGNRSLLETAMLLLAVAAASLGVAWGNARRCARPLK